MGYFAVVREAGPRWDPTQSLREQAGWDEHADFMDALADDGFVVLGGPLADGRRALLVVAAPSEIEIRRRLEHDPWTSMELLSIVSVEPWQVLFGPDLLASASISLAS